MVRLVAMMNNTLIRPAPTLSSKAPAKEAPKMKKTTDRTTLPAPIAVIIQISRLANSAQNDVSTKLTTRIPIRNAGLSKVPPCPACTRLTGHCQQTMH